MGTAALVSSSCLAEVVCIQPVRLLLERLSERMWSWLLRQGSGVACPATWQTCGVACSEACNDTLGSQEHVQLSRSQSKKLAFRRNTVLEVCVQSRGRYTHLVGRCTIGEKLFENSRRKYVCRALPSVHGTCPGILRCHRGITAVAAVQGHDHLSDVSCAPEACRVQLTS